MELILRCQKLIKKAALPKKASDKAEREPAVKEEDLIENYELAIDVVDGCLALAVLKDGDPKYQLDFSASQQEWELMRDYIDQAFESFNESNVDE